MCTRICTRVCISVLNAARLHSHLRPYPHPHPHPLAATSGGRWRRATCQRPTRAPRCAAASASCCCRASRRARRTRFGERRRQLLGVRGARTGFWSESGLWVCCTAGRAGCCRRRAPAAVKRKEAPSNRCTRTPAPAGAVSEGAAAAAVSRLLDRLQAGGFICAWQVVWADQPGGWPPDWFKQVRALIRTGCFDVAVAVAGLIVCLRAQVLRLWSTDMQMRARGPLACPLVPR